MAKKLSTLLFDASPLIGRRTGIGNYTLNLVEAMARAYPNVQFVGYYFNFLGRKKGPSNQLSNISFRPILWAPGLIVHQLRRIGIQIPIELLTLKRSDFILFSNFLSYPSLLNTPIATTVYDLAYIDVPEYGSSRNIQDLQRFMPKTIRRAALVLTISEFSKQRIVDVYNTPVDKIVTTFIPPVMQPDTSQADTKRSLKKLGLTKPFLLTIGTLEPRKNIERLLDAYTKLPTEMRAQFSLVLVGKYDWKFEAIKRKIEQLQADGYDIVNLGYVDDQARSALYQGARLYVMASLYEGFGMPVIEAMQNGLACAVSDIPVLHELGGAVTTYFDPKDSQNMANIIEECLKQAPQPQKLKQHVRDLPDWQQVAKQVMDRITGALS